MSAVDAVNRPSSRAQRGRLKLAGRASLADAGGAAELHREHMVRVGPVALSRCTVHSVENDDHFVGIDTALDLDLLAGEPRHARALAEAQSYTLTPNASNCAAPIGHANINRIVRAFTDFELTMREGLEDGSFDAAEAAEALDILNRLEAEIVSKRAKLLAVVRAEVSE